MTRISAKLALTAAFLATAPAFAAEDFKTHFMTNWDANSDGKVTLVEAKERREAIFAAFDADEDGYLAEAELANMDEMRKTEHADMGKSAGGGHGMGMGRRKGAMSGNGQGQGMGAGHGFQQAAEGGMHNRRMLDADGDGKISKEEFAGMTDRWFARLDANSDGAIDASDID